MKKGQCLETAPFFLFVGQKGGAEVWEAPGTSTIALTSSITSKRSWIVSCSLHQLPLPKLPGNTLTGSAAAGKTVTVN